MPFVSLAINAEYFPSNPSSVPQPWSFSVDAAALWPTDAPNMMSIHTWRIVHGGGWDRYYHFNVPATSIKENTINTAATTAGWGTLRCGTLTENECTNSRDGKHNGWEAGRPATVDDEGGAAAHNRHTLAISKDQRITIATAPLETRQKGWRQRWEKSQAHSVSWSRSTHEFHYLRFKMEKTFGADVLWTPGRMNDAAQAATTASDGRSVIAVTYIGI